MWANEIAFDSWFDLFYLFGANGFEMVTVSPKMAWLDQQECGFAQKHWKFNMND